MPACASFSLLVRGDASTGRSGWSSACGLAHLGQDELGKRRRRTVFEVNISDRFTDTRDCGTIEAGREHIFLVATESPGLCALAFVVCPELSAVRFRNEHDAEPGFVAIDVIEVSIKVLAPQSRLLVSIVEHTRAFRSEIRGYAGNVGAVFAGERETHVVLESPGADWVLDPAGQPSGCVSPSSWRGSAAGSGVLCFRLGLACVFSRSTCGFRVGSFAAGRASRLL
jgi:hypothetical protein